MELRASLLIPAHNQPHSSWHGLQGSRAVQAVGLSQDAPSLTGSPGGSPRPQWEDAGPGRTQGQSVLAPPTQPGPTASVSPQSGQRLCKQRER